MDDIDLALILALDGSASVDFDEFNLLANGCAAGLRDPDVIAGLVGGVNGASIVAVLLWSGANAHAVLVDWTRVTTPPEVASLAEAVENVPRLVRPGETAIGEALLACEALFAVLPAQPARRVIDIAGDGASNAGVLPGPIRDRLADAGITINGLCVLHEEPDLLASYTNDVIGGPDAFALQCRDYAGFAVAMRQKLRREIAAAALAKSRLGMI